MTQHILTYIIFLPLFVAIALGLTRANVKTLKLGAMLSSIVILLLVGFIAITSPYFPFSLYVFFYM